MSPPQETDSSLRDLDPLPGRVIAGNFRVEKLIGQGAMGNVYKAEQLSLGKAVAVKVLHPHLMSDEKLVGRFKREAKSASRLNHANSIQIIDSGQDQQNGGMLYIAMELLDGRDLAQVLREEFPMPLPRVVRIMSQVMAALDEAHAQGVIHRDLKPSNIMLIERRGEKDFVKVCDFGIAKAVGDGKDDDREQMLTIQGLVCGTPEYMSPEQARAEPLDGRADLYSAAIILYQLVTGDIPFKADSPMGIVSRHLAEVPKAPSLRRPDLPIPKVMDELILRGMEKSRELRYPNALAFRAALEGIVSGSQGQFTPFPPGVQAAIPTAPAIESSPSNRTAVIPPAGAADRFGSTTDLTGKRAPRAPAGLVFGAALVVGGAAAAYIAARGAPAPATPAVAVVAAVEPAPAPPPAPKAVEPVAPAPSEAPPAPEAPPAEVAASPARPASPERRHRHRSQRAPKAPAIAPVVPTPEPPTAPAVRVPAAAASVSPGPAPEAAPPARGPREVLLEAEKLLSQGEVSDACARGEEAKKMAPKQPGIHKFLGKCYMRAGKAPQANENYKKYLELAPTASDAPFIKSMLK
jgi:serine/threonine-protein kinase